MSVNFNRISFVAQQVKLLNLLQKFVSYVILLKVLDLMIWCLAQVFLWTLNDYGHQRRQYANLISTEIIFGLRIRFLRFFNVSHD